MKAALSWMLDAYERWRDRRLLEDMTERDLRDMGLTRQQVRREVEKPFWRV